MKTYYTFGVPGLVAPQRVEVNTEARDFDHCPIGGARLDTRLRIRYPPLDHVILPVAQPDPVAVHRPPFTTIRVDKLYCVETLPNPFVTIDPKSIVTVWMRTE